jgi:putative transposase
MAEDREVKKNRNESGDDRRTPNRGLPMPPADANGRRLRLIDQIVRRPEDRLAEVERLLGELSAGAPGANQPAQAPAARDWPHAPLHRLSAEGTYIVTAGTYGKEHHFRGAARLDHLESSLLEEARESGWQLEAWAVFSNHYHFVAHAQPGCQPLRNWLARLHQDTSSHVNQLDGQIGRRVWYNYWDTELTFEKSYLTRLAYVHQNAVKHGLVRVANQYRWCSAAWFERTATPAQVRTIYAFKTDQVNVHDDFDPI